MRALATVAALALIVAGRGPVGAAWAQPAPGPAATPQKLIHTTTAMGTSVMITVWADDEPAAATAAEAAFAESGGSTG